MKKKNIIKAPKREKFDIDLFSNTKYPEITQLFVNSIVEIVNTVFDADTYFYVDGYKQVYNLWYYFETTCSYSDCDYNEFIVAQKVLNSVTKKYTITIYVQDAFKNHIEDVKITDSESPVYKYFDDLIKYLSINKNIEDDNTNDE